jgi:hypothetical protein
MGERTPGLDPESSQPKNQPANVEVLSGEISAVRAELDTLLGELDRRRHDVLDVPLQVRRHAVGASLTVLALIATVAASVWLGLSRRRRRDGVGARAGRLRHAVARMTAHPERVASEPTVAGKIAVAAASAAVAALIKKFLERGVEKLLETNNAERPAPVSRARNGGAVPSGRT